MILNIGWMHNRQESGFELFWGWVVSYFGAGLLELFMELGWGLVELFWVKLGLD